MNFRHLLFSNTKKECTLRPSFNAKTKRSAFFRYCLSIHQDFIGLLLQVFETSRFVKRQRTHHHRSHEVMLRVAFLICCLVPAVEKT